MNTTNAICWYQQMRFVRAFTDGSVHRSPFTGKAFAGWSYVILDCKRLRPDLLEWGNGLVETDQSSPSFIGATTQSSNTAELSGIFWAAAAMVRLQIKGAIIFSDSLYSIKSIEGNYSLRKNRPLIKQVRALVLPEYRLRWLKGHSGNTANEIADALASASLSELK